MGFIAQGRCETSAEICIRKKRYPSRRAVVLAAKCGLRDKLTDEPVCYFQCRHCGGWHIGRAKREAAKMVRRKHADE